MKKYTIIAIIKNSDEKVLEEFVKQISSLSDSDFEIEEITITPAFDILQYQVIINANLSVNNLCNLNNIVTNDNIVAFSIEKRRKGKNRYIYFDRLPRKFNNNVIHQKAVKASNNLDMSSYPNPVIDPKKKQIDNNNQDDNKNNE